MRPPYAAGAAIVSLFIVGAVTAGNTETPTIAIVDDTPTSSTASDTTTTIPPVATTPETVDRTPPVTRDLVVSDATPATRGTAAQVTDTLPPPPSSTLPPWTGRRPAYYGAGSECSPVEATIVADRFRTVGASYSTIEWMLGVMSRESNCTHTARNNTAATGDDSFGLCQLNARSGHFGPDGILAGWDRWRILESFEYSVEACAAMWERCGRGPWNYGNYYCTRPTS